MCEHCLFFWRIKLIQTWEFILNKDVWLIEDVNVTDWTDLHYYINEEGHIYIQMVLIYTENNPHCGFKLFKYPCSSVAHDASNGKGHGFDSGYPWKTKLYIFKAIHVTLDKSFGVSINTKCK